MVPFEQFFGEIVSSFANTPQSSNELDTWLVAQKLARDYGGTAVNAAGTSGKTGALNWARASMSDEWMDHYVNRQFIRSDPFVAALVRGEAGFQIEAGTVSRDAADPLAYELNHNLKDSGAQSFFASCHGGHGTNARTMVVHCSELSLRDLDGQYGLSRIRLLQAVIAANVGSPAQNSGPGFVDLPSPLSVREREILAWPADGYRNDEIAFRLGIAEVTVRKHVISVRRKLKARTREQALAMAVQAGWLNS